MVFVDTTASPAVGSGKMKKRVSPRGFSQAYKNVFRKKKSNGFVAFENDDDSFNLDGSSSSNFSHTNNNLQGHPFIHDNSTSQNLPMIAEKQPQQLQLMTTSASNSTTIAQCFVTPIPTTTTNTSIASSSQRGGRMNDPLDDSSSNRHSFFLFQRRPTTTSTSGSTTCSNNKKMIPKKSKKSDGHNSSSFLHHSDNIYSSTQEDQSKKDDLPMDVLRQSFSSTSSNLSDITFQETAAERPHTKSDFKSVRLSL